jgi:2-polyprenyl-3-methyl-5-hydroxy-6-metoxy-1,4-benzoquinol methylase
VTENRQRLADSPLRNRTASSDFVVTMRHFARSLAYRIPVVRRTIEKATEEPKQAARRWDRLLSETHFSTYLGGTINVDASNLMTAMLIKYHCRQSPALLDVGCAGGTLVAALSSFSRYVGTDVSAHAIATARADPDLGSLIATGRVSFEVSDLREYRPAGAFDAIVFNEVLYYLHSEAAIAEVERYAKSLGPNGVFCVSLKDDPKSHAILSSLLKRFAWIDGMLYQRKANDPGYRIRLNRERPGFLVGVFGARPASG